MTHRNVPIHLAIDFSEKPYQSGERDGTFSHTEGKTLSTENAVFSKVLRNKEETKTFPYKQKLRKYISARPVVQEMTENLQAERTRY